MTTSYKGITVPDLTDPPNAPQQLRALVDTGGAVPRFATLAEANAAYPAGQRPVGMIVSIGGLFYTSNGSTFVTPIQGGGVPTFATAAARDAAIPSPAVGAMCVVSDFPFSPLHYGRWEPAAANRWLGTLAGSFYGYTNASYSDAIVNFPTLVSGGAPFSASPILSGIVDLQSRGVWITHYGVNPGYPNGAGFIVGVRDSHDGITSERPNNNVYLSYFATGPVG